MQGDHGETETWTEYRLLILDSLRKIEASMKSQAADIQSLTQEVTILKTKIVILGIAASVLVSALVTVITNALSK